MMKRLLFAVLACALLATSCVPPPRGLTPAAALAFNNTRVVKGLDLLRDAVVDANRQVPPLVSTGTLLRVVRYHQSAVKIIDASVAGWKPVVLVGLDELTKSLPVGEKVFLAPYFALTKALVTEVTR